MYTPEINHVESEDRIISVCPRKLTSVQHFFITGNRPTFWTVHGSCSGRGMRKRKSFEGKIIHEIEAIEKLKCLTHDETVLHTLDPVIKRAV